jgi:hypothetical protein
LLNTLIKYLVIIFVVSNIALTFYWNRSRLWFTLLIWKGFRWKMILETIGLLIATLTTAALLYEYLPFGQLGWYQLLFGENTNIILTPVKEGIKSSNILIKLTVPIFVIALLLILPFLAELEELNFRMGYHNRRSIIIQSIKFGLIHMIMGIPLAVAIALIGVGLFYARKYLDCYKKFSRDHDQKYSEQCAVLFSTIYHTLYNSVLAVMLLVLSIVMIFFG